MAGNPILGFLDTTNTPAGTRGNVTKSLRLLGLTVLAGGIVSVLNSVLSLSMGTSYNATTAALVTSTLIVTMLFTVAVTTAVLFWITYATNAWNRDQPSGATHALVIGILATIFGGFGVLSMFLAGIIAGTIGLFSGANTVLFIVVGVLSGILSAVECYAGIMVLVNRSKTTSGATATST